MAVMAYLLVLIAVVLGEETATAGVLVAPTPKSQENGLLQADRRHNVKTKIKEAARPRTCGVAAVLVISLLVWLDDRLDQKNRGPGAA